MSLLQRSTTLLLVLLALCSHTVFAHTYLSAVYLDNSLLGQGDCVRPHPSTAFDYPIPLVNQADMTCGWLPSAANAANRKCPIAAGSTIGIQWHHNSNSASDDILDATHKGPVMVYLAKSETGSGSVWFKIYEDGYVNGAWGVDRLIANKGRVDVTIPSDIAPGNYLLRGEVIALHNAYDLNGVQPYVGCVELTISGSGSATPATVAFPGAYSPSDPGLLFNIYNSFTSYVIPGPAVYKSGSGSSSGSNHGSAAATSAPTTAPTTRPTTAPSTSPTTSPTSSPSTSPSGESLKIQVNGGSNVWWFAVAVSGGSENTVKVELADSGSVSNYYIMSPTSYGFYFSQSVQLTLPISLRFTSASGKQIVLEKYITSFFETSIKDTERNYGTVSNPTSAPTTKSTNAPTAYPTYAPTSAPTSAPPANNNGDKITFQQHSGSSNWWFAVSVSGIGASEISRVELKDSNEVSEFASLESTNWGYYTLPTTGFPLVAPVTLRVTTTSGTQATATFSAVSGNSQVQTTL